jgi:hypothetical protein
MGTGSGGCAGRYLFILLYKGFKEKKWMYYDSAIHVFQPYFLMITSVFLLIQFVPVLQDSYYNIFAELIPYTVWQIVSSGITILPVVSLYLDRVPIKAYLGLILYPIFMYSWVPIIFLGFIDRNKKNGHIYSYAVIAITILPLTRYGQDEKLVELKS